MWFDYAVKPNNLLINSTSERAAECLYSTCPLLILCITSIPAIVFSVVLKDLDPNIGFMIFFMGYRQQNVKNVR
jgi:hypothetical protein